LYNHILFWRSVCQIVLEIQQIVFRSRDNCHGFERRSVESPIQSRLPCRSNSYKGILRWILESKYSSNDFVLLFYRRANLDICQRANNRGDLLLYAWVRWRLDYNSM